jgi:hypothetical protein
VGQAALADSQVLLFVSVIEWDYLKVIKFVSLSVAITKEILHILIITNELIEFHGSRLQTLELHVFPYLYFLLSLINSHFRLID